MSQSRYQKCKDKIYSFCRDFWEPLKSKSPKFRDQTFAYTLGSTLSNMKAPALFSLAFGLLIIVSPDSVDKVLLDSIDEYLQNTGGAIVLYSSVMIYGLILLTCKSFIGLCNFLRVVLQATCYLGHLILSVTAGIALGLLLPTFIELEIKEHIYAYCAVVLQLTAIAVCYQIVCKSSTEEFMAEFVEQTNLRSKNARWPAKYLNGLIVENESKLRIVSGWLLFISAFITLLLHEF